MRKITSIDVYLNNAIKDPKYLNVSKLSVMVTLFVLFLTKSIEFVCQDFKFESVQGSVHIDLLAIALPKMGRIPIHSSDC